MAMSTERKNRIIRIVLCCLITAAMLLCLAGCRDRITNRDDADKQIQDKSGTMTEEYQKRRGDLKLGRAPEPLVKEKQDKKETAEADNTGDQNENGDGPGSGNNGNGDGGNEGGPGNGTGNGEGDNPGGNEGQDPQKEEQDDEKTVDVHFDANGGALSGSAVRKYTVGKKYGSLPTAEKDGFSLAGWYSAAEGGKRVNSSDVVPNKEHTLYAHWTDKRMFTITFDPGEEGRMKDREKTREMKKGDRYGTLPLPVRDGHDFRGWYTSREGGSRISENGVFSEEKDMTFYAHWEYNPYKYWSTMRTIIYESMYACQIVDCYIEFEDNKTASYSDLLEGCKAGNCARNRGSDTTVTDEWVESRNPSAIVKVNMSGGSPANVKAKVSARFPGRRVIVVPKAAVSGSDKERLYYILCLGKAIYPDWFDEIDLNKAGKELGVSGNIYE
ncbi:MAG: InlB B-repeat-containing protein [Bacillota bacterium]|nr:InlB B-repeat-containing protein [Bacillota bacterium]